MEIEKLNSETLHKSCKEETDLKVHLYKYFQMCISLKLGISVRRCLISQFDLESQSDPDDPTETDVRLVDAQHLSKSGHPAEELEYGSESLILDSHICKC